MFNENYNIIGDYEYFMRISKVCSAKSINSPMLNYRVHDNNLSKTNIHIFLGNGNNSTSLIQEV